MLKNRNLITTITSTLCRLMEISAPAQCTGAVIQSLVDYVFNELGIKKIEKCLIFAPDAVGEIVYQNNKQLFSGIFNYAPVTLELSSVFIPVTPVCFASMFSGALPEVHGIKKYQKPALKIDTIFDRLIAEDKNPAIVAVRDSSIDLIFRNREMAYYSENYDQEVIDRTISLLQENKHDFILSYNQEYDDCMHETVPFSDKSIKALKNQNRNFVTLAKAFDEAWAGYNRLIMYTPDHGCHIDPATGKGDHGEDIPDDMNVIHFCGIARAGEKLISD